jgi:subtilase family serine protease
MHPYLTGLYVYLCIRADQRQFVSRQHVITLVDVVEGELSGWSQSWAETAQRASYRKESTYIDD